MQHGLLVLLDEAVPVFVKQVWVNGRCSKDPAEWPEALRVQELPEAWKRIVRKQG
jgi:hypothetical protein